MKVSEIILSWDTLIALLITGLTCSLLPTNLALEFCSEVFTIGITVLSIIFSLFFASLAIIMTSSADKFIVFLEEKGDFIALLNSFKITLIMLFISLSYTIGLFFYTVYLIKDNLSHEKQSYYFFLSFELLFVYSLVSTALSINDTIIFSKMRAKFLHPNDN
ncbi:MAG: hypothetical protein JWP94_3299 [Mucilaginibacter sp.]|nr:hypothetical protein [Mucilaginibacter sp.]